MPSSTYKVFSTGAAVGDGVTQSIYVSIAGIAKKASPAHPYIVANELICNRIGLALLLPCPPGAIMEHGGEPYFFSLDFNVAGHSLPPITPANVTDQLPRESWGVISFDTFIMNADRHRKNIAFDTATKKLHIFDHSHALLGPSGDIDARLLSADKQMCIGKHCLAREIATDDGKTASLNRIGSLPDYFLDGVVDAAARFGIPADKKQPVSDFLKRRRDSIETLVTSNAGSFPKLPKGTP